MAAQEQGASAQGAVMDPAVVVVPPQSATHSASELEQAKLTWRGRIGPRVAACGCLAALVVASGAGVAHYAAQSRDVLADVVQPGASLDVHWANETHLRGEFRRDNHALFFDVAMPIGLTNLTYKDGDNAEGLVSVAHGGRAQALLPWRRGRVSGKWLLAGAAGHARLEASIAEVLSRDTETLLGSAASGMGCGGAAAAGCADGQPEPEVAELVALLGGRLGLALGRASIKLAAMGLDGGRYPAAHWLHFLARHANTFQHNATAFPDSERLLVNEHLLGQPSGRPDAGTEAEAGAEGGGRRLTGQPLYSVC
eukprot:CAMPEP_0168358604 /NCGR_PEP_ID=MMETSP0228-20121227/1205_1 /TAXON_ID=133427 /ORGANISM="Protoceratium reticulatum, Strain CCCM 535 (=CCMP 1889)" /LENGTH=310 /DNA_ID=CAMNT_0008371193 /DNA_START=55 /DNA_END=984 /DNA_ORIENTATION=+